MSRSIQRQSRIFLCLIGLARPGDVVSNPSCRLFSRKVGPRSYQLLFGLRKFTSELSVGHHVYLELVFYVTDQWQKHVDRKGFAESSRDSKPQSTIPNIRERLQLWEDQNITGFVSVPDIYVRPSVIPDEIFNKGSNLLGFRKSVENDFEHTLCIEDESDGVVRNFLIPGDLVELESPGTVAPELAIYMRQVDFQLQFYTMSGRWLHKRSSGVGIYFPGFVEPHELEEVLPYLPQKDIAREMEDKLHGFEHALPQNIGKTILDKMSDFWTQSEAVYEETAAKLDNAHRTIAHPTDFTYATLIEIADRILYRVISKNKNGVFPSPALYALHRHILHDDVGFSAANTRKVRAQTQYEITPLRLAEEMARVLGYVRKYNNFKVNKGRAEKPRELLEFAKKAYNIIDQSRTTREFTTHGCIGPHNESSAPGPKSSKQNQFNVTDLEFVRFLEMFAGLAHFGSSSKYTACTSTILRAIGQYRDQDIVLDRSTVWTCLKEIGALTPWQTVAEYGLRAPHTSKRIRLGPVISQTRTDYDLDMMKSLRTDWGDMDVYCIDDANAQELDDGISLEATESTEVYWVHIHVADPTSILDPNGPESKYAQALGDTMFLPDRKVPILRHDLVMNHMSLAPGRSCLTFSAKINIDGELLESQIRPGVLGRVLFVTPKVFADVGTGVTRRPLYTYTVGSRVGLHPSPRNLIEQDQLSAKQKDDLRIIARIGSARKRVLERNGAVLSNNRCSLVKVAFTHVESSALDSHQYVQPTCDPTIQISVPPEYQDYLINRRVENQKNDEDPLSIMMLLAGQIAAEWCSERGLPIPYRVTLNSIEKQDPTEYHRQNILPRLKRGQVVPLEVHRAYMNLVGPAHLSTSIGPHVALGMNAYSKVTSPLRRYLDLVVHWQINAALREEASSGKSLIGNSKDHFLPFSKSQLDKILPHSQRLEHQTKYYQRCLLHEWKCHYLFRAWKFSQAQLPSPLVFVVNRASQSSDCFLTGELPCFALHAVMSLPLFMPIEDIKEGDLFEVEIKNIQIAYQKVILEPIRGLKPEDISWLN